MAKQANPAMAVINREYAKQQAIFNNGSLQAAIAWLRAHGVTLGTIISVILANIPAIETAIASGNPASILTLLLGIIGPLNPPPTTTVPTAGI